MKKEIKILIVLFLCVFMLNYSLIDAFLIETFIDYEEGIVERIIDGDTIVVRSTTKFEVGSSKFGKKANKTEEIKIRMLGINSPEKGEIAYKEAKEFLENKILKKNVRINFDKEKKDRYNRTLGYIFLGKQNINLESVKQGYSNFYFPTGAGRYSKEIKEAWEECLISNKRLCEKSKNDCISLKKIDIKNQKIILENICNYDIYLKNWSIKDEGRKKYIFLDEKIKSMGEITLNSNKWNKDYVWTKTGDSVFIRDDKNKLVLFYNY